GAGRAHAVGLQKNHDAADGLLLLPARANSLNAAWANAFHFLQKCRTGIDHIERALAEDGDDLLRVMRSDALDQAGAQELFNSVAALRRRAAQALGLELLPVVA